MKILVTYAGSGGLAAGTAERVGKVLSGLGESVTLMPMSGVTTLKGYAAVIAGSVEHAGSWVPEAMEFVRRSQSALKEKAFAIFTVCTELTPDKGAEAHMVIMQWTAPVRALAHPVSEGFFTAENVKKKESQPGEKSRFKLNILFGILKESDLRHQQVAIETWATKLHEKLAQSSKWRA
ncbi:MAG: flavodoxin domain-containing protein [Bacteroidales bacterium]